MARTASRLTSECAEPTSEPPATPQAAGSTSAQGTEGPPLASEDGAPPTNEPVCEAPVPIGAGGSAGGPLTWENYKEFVVPFLGPRSLFGSDD